MAPGFPFNDGKSGPRMWFFVAGRWPVKALCALS